MNKKHCPISKTVNSICYVYYYKRKKKEEGRWKGGGGKTGIRERRVLLFCFPLLTFWNFYLLDNSIDNRLYHGCKLLENIIISKQSVFLKSQARN